MAESAKCVFSKMLLTMLLLGLGFFAAVSVSLQFQIPDPVLERERLELELGKTFNEAQARLIVAELTNFQIRLYEVNRQAYISLTLSFVFLLSALYLRRIDVRSGVRDSAVQSSESCGFWVQRVGTSGTPDNIPSCH